MFGVIKNKWFSIAVAVLLLQIWVIPNAGAKTYNFKISLESVPSHPKTKGVEIFIKQLVKRSKGQLKPKLYHSSQLYKDAHATKAVNMGTLQMSVVGNYLLDGFDINATVTHLPMFFGQPEKVTVPLIDSVIAKKVTANLEKKLKLKIIGRPFHLGLDHCYTLRAKITELKDFKGLRLRHAGGAISTPRLEALGAEGVVIPYPDLPMALSRGLVDGLTTTTKTVESAKLHECGLKYAIETRNYFTFYFPLVNKKFWNGLPPDLQKIFIEVWEETVPKEREIARLDQQKAKEFLQSKGMEFYSPSDEKLAKWRKHIMYIQDGLVKDLKFDQDLIKVLMKKLSM